MPDQTAMPDSQTTKEVSDIIMQDAKEPDDSSEDPSQSIDPSNLQSFSEDAGASNGASSSIVDVVAENPEILACL